MSEWLLAIVVTVGSLLLAAFFADVIVSWFETREPPHL